MPSNKKKPATRRLFFALWPDDELRVTIRKHLKKVIQHGGGKRVHEQNLHITLCFLGSLDDEALRCVEQFADTLQFQAVDLIIDKADFWQKPRILWAGCTHVPQNLISFVHQLNLGMNDCGISLDARPFVPHITLMRKVNKAPQDMEFKAFHWNSTTFSLVESQTLPEGVKYTVIKRW